MSNRRIAINTGGGDAPGLNAVIRAATLSALELGFEVWGIRHGYDGLIDRDLVPLTRERVRGITHIGGTILGAARRTGPKNDDAAIVAAFRERGFDAVDLGCAPDDEAAMTAADLVPLASEWWHFEAADATRYPLADEPLR